MYFFHKQTLPRQESQLKQQNEQNVMKYATSNLMCESESFWKGNRTELHTHRTEDCAWRLNWNQRIWGRTYCGDFGKMGGQSELMFQEVEDDANNAMLMHVRYEYVWEPLLKPAYKFGPEKRGSRTDPAKRAVI